MDQAKSGSVSPQGALESDFEPGFAPIAAEIRRQFDLEIEFDGSSDTKIGIFLGFIVIVIVQLSLNTDLVLREQGPA
jgi:hypothetical protein